MTELRLKPQPMAWPERSNCVLEGVGPADVADDPGELDVAPLVSP